MEALIPRRSLGDLYHQIEGLENMSGMRKYSVTAAPISSESVANQSGRLWVVGFCTPNRQKNAA